jgi:hypothetical protein
MVPVSGRVLPAPAVLPRQERIPDPVIQRAITGIATTSQQARSCPLVNGVHLTDVALTTAGEQVPHGLGRAWIGYIVTRSSSGAAVFDQGAQRDATKYVSLQSASNVVVDLWVF